MLTAILLTACSSGPDEVQPDPTGPVVYIGAEACGTCHQAELAAWQNSHHDLAMTEAGPETVSASFDASYTYAGIESRFERSGDGKDSPPSAPSGRPSG